MKALEVTGLSKAYKGGVLALKDVSFEMNEGDFFALLGPNGAGKSTLIGILSALVKKSSGQVKVFGYDLDKELLAVKSCIGVVPQEFNFSMFEKVLDIVANQAGYYGIRRKEALQRAEYYLKQLGLWDKRDQIARNLSGGMKRRLMIVRALIHEPKLLILDEPTAGVDIELRRSMWDFLERVNKEGTTIILTTHYLEEAENLCRHIAIINKGEIVKQGSMMALLKELDKEYFILYLKNPCEFIPELNNYPINVIDPLTLEVEISNDQSVSDLLRVLAEVGIEVSRLRNKTNRLEELFVRLTSDGV